MVFDYRHFGASGGEPRNHIVPFEQQQDLRNAITWLRTQPEVDPDRMGGWGISLGGVYMLQLGAYDRRLKAVVSVATGLNASENMMGRAGLQGFLRMINGDRDQRFKSGSAANYIPAVSMPGKVGMMPIQDAYDFYLDAQKTYAPTYENRVTFESLEFLFSDHSEQAADLVSPTALLMIHGEKDLIPVEAVRAVFERVGEPKKLVVLDCLHTDLYTREPWVTESSDAAIEWFNRYLHNQPANPDKPQDIEQNKKIIRYFYEESLKGNLSVYDELFTPDFVSYSSAAGGELRGPEAFKQANIMYTRAFPDFYTTVDMIIAENNQVVVYGVASGTHKGEMMGLPPTSKKISWTGIAIYRFNDDGKIDGRWQEFDALGMFQQLGLIPPMMGAAG